MTQPKSLAQMLGEMRPVISTASEIECDLNSLPADISEVEFVSRASYDRMKQVAIELAIAVEFYANAIEVSGIGSLGEPHIEAHLMPRRLGSFANEALSRAKDIIGGGE